MKKKVIVISAVNLVNGGPFTLLKECLDALSVSEIVDHYKVIAIVHKKSLLPVYKTIELIEYPRAKKNWLLRCYYEYYVFYKLSKQLNPLMWLSLHDMSPNVTASVQAVYMHNPTPFYKTTYKDWWYAPIYAIFSLFYKYIYRINIHSNVYLIVQQQWLRNAFAEMFRIDRRKIIVAPPPNDHTEKHIGKSFLDKNHILFFYPAYPRIFKNFEVVCKATRLLEKEGFDNFRVILTIDGSENKYSNQIVKEFSNLQTISFVGVIPPEEMLEYYKKTDCLLFPSLLETWGLPISEFKNYSRIMLVADLPYAHETASGTNAIAFFDPHRADILAYEMKNVLMGDYSSFRPVPPLDINSPVEFSWKCLFDRILRAAENKETDRTLML